MLTKYLLPVALLISASCLVQGDEPPPRPRPKPPAPTPAKEVGSGALVIEIDANAATPRLQIPRKLLGTAADPQQPQKNAVPSTPEKRGDAGFPVLPTIMTGLALSLALGFGGLWLVRRRVAGKGALFGAVLLGAVAVAWADVPPINPGPRPPRPAPRPVEPATLRLDKVTIEIVEQGDTVRLLINPVELTKIKANAK